MSGLPRTGLFKAVKESRSNRVKRCIAAAAKEAARSRDARSVYAITAPEIGRVKFGFSVEPSERLKDIQCCSPVELNMAAVVEGGPSLEGLIHKEFDGSRRIGEWFDLDDDALALIDAMRDGLDAVEDFFIRRLIGRSNP